MKQKNILVFDQNYGLWYDRRRDDHERVRRRDGDVWGPFYEQPFGRSGQGTAWEGLSKYDLNRPNAWYWSRLKEFAEKGNKDGLLLFHENYFQHNILEAGAHWVDCPWRSTNNINQTGFRNLLRLQETNESLLQICFMTSLIRFAVSYTDNTSASV